ncbi:hypothetical protein [Oceanobacillus sp. Castelsardo]|uniref:hypothetical protein n=1 Tax=Oceanobacillus sp. Castelsardo TaxID=1851204 RepID=UPI000837AD01|nr:hypothetical protein [Oceanobacillus sp. Castelsardo]
MSRLEEIKRAYGYGGRLPKDTYPYWLIQRVESSKKVTDEALKQIDVTQARNERLEKRVGELEHHLKMANEAMKISNDSSLSNFILEQQNQRFKQALEFYADEDNYVYPLLYTEDDKPIHDQSEVDMDGGKKARQALEESK